MLRAYLVLLSLTLAWGCDSADIASEPDIADECNPLGGVACLLPWPSSAYLVEADTATGYRVELPVAAMPVNAGGVSIDPAPFNRFDGFSPSGAILAAFPEEILPDSLPSHRDPQKSLDPESATVVLNMDTGDRLLHFAEVDMNAEVPEDRVLVIRPLERMAPGARYAVAIRSRVTAAGGAPLSAPPVFAALRDGKRDFAHPRMAALGARYDAIFTALEADGVPRDELVLAWDFVTASDAMLTADLLAMREQAEPVMDAGLAFTADEVEADPALVYRALRGTHQAANFLSAGESSDSRLVRDAAGAPVRDGFYDANVAVILPACVTEPGVLPIPVVVFGHGLFGSGAAYLSENFIQEMANQGCFAVVAGDFIGLTARQAGDAAVAATDLNLAGAVTDKLAQSIINFMALAHMVRGPFAQDERFQYQGQTILDTERVFYLGASLGGIMGNVLMAYEKTMERGALGVPGGAWSLLFERSLAWSTLKIVAMNSYPDPRDYQLLVALLAMRFEPYDPITTAPRVIQDPLPDTPAKQILMYEAVGDSLVTNLSTEMTARTMGVGVTGPSLRVPYGLSESAAPLASGLTIYDEAPAPLPPDTNVPPEQDNGTHGDINRRGAVVRQVRHFLFTGEVIHTCQVDGAAVPCDCTTGACDL